VAGPAEVQSSQELLWSPYFDLLGHEVHSRPGLEWERVLLQRGHRLIAGVDEVGRGSWAGPLVAAAVVLPLDSALQSLDGVRDSKQLAPSLREELSETIRRVAIAVGVAIVSHTAVDDLGIAAANRQALSGAVAALGVRPDALLIDYFRLPESDLPQLCMPHGDDQSLSIAAASIVAKVTRDGWMRNVDTAYPQYGFARNKGYGTVDHRRALRDHGPCPLHRLSFRPLKTWHP